MLHAVLEYEERAKCVFKDKIPFVKDFCVTEETMRRVFAFALSNDVGISFDDGYANSMKWIIASSRLGIDTTVFLSTGYLGGWFKDSDVQMLSKTDIWLLDKNGVKIQNHTHSHTEWSNMSLRQMLYDVEICSQKIEEITGKRPTAVAAPKGDVNGYAIKLQEEGYDVYGVGEDVERYTFGSIPVNEEGLLIKGREVRWQWIS